MTNKELQEIKERLNKDYANNLEELLGTLGSYMKDIVLLIGEVERLRELNRWIPVKERLPENNKHVQLFLKDDKGKTAQVVGLLYHSDKETFKKFNGNFAAFDGDYVVPSYLIKEFVIAWRKLPEGYKDE